MHVEERALIQLIYLKPDGMSSDFRLYRTGSDEISVSFASLYSVACHLDENQSRIKLIFEKSRYDWEKVETRSSVTISDRCALARVVLWHVDSMNGLSASAESSFVQAKIADTELQPENCFWVIDLSQHIIHSRAADVFQVIGDFEETVDKIKGHLR